MPESSRPFSTFPTLTPWIDQSSYAYPVYQDYALTDLGSQYHRTSENFSRYPYGGSPNPPAIQPSQLPPDFNYTRHQDSLERQNRPQFFDAVHHSGSLQPPESLVQRVPPALEANQCKRQFKPNNAIRLMGSFAGVWYDPYTKLYHDGDGTPRATPYRPNESRISAM